ncbi:CLUMA_CG007772, isoform A [Clunio marinus]|uniref:CLUMA_CG007772, isoform A n=1 Tax=Clunio marinus TaxID=568069 RepID=A0A1J1I762_9DIPT|nr:CLUMA_CG007772, isoform A [Clunio marinus]
MKKFVLFVFIIAMAIAMCSSFSIGDSTESEDPMRSSRGIACTSKWVPFSLRNAACNTWCMKALKRPGGYCSSKLVCTCYKPK